MRRSQDTIKKECAERVRECGGSDFSYESAGKLSYRCKRGHLHNKTAYKLLNRLFCQTCDLIDKGNAELAAAKIKHITVIACKRDAYFCECVRGHSFKRIKKEIARIDCPECLKDPTTQACHHIAKSYGGKCLTPFIESNDAIATYITHTGKRFKAILSDLFKGKWTGSKPEPATVSTEYLLPIPPPETIVQHSCVTISSAFTASAILRSEKHIHRRL